MLGIEAGQKNSALCAIQVGIPSMGTRNLLIIWTQNFNWVQGTLVKFLCLSLKVS